jgi:hypothetical protein
MDDGEIRSINGKNNNNKEVQKQHTLLFLSAYSDLIFPGDPFKFKEEEARMSEEIVEKLLQINARLAAVVRTPPASMEREEYRRALNFVEAVIFSCGDGRNNPCLAVKAPYGVIPRFCTPGCAFEIGELLFDDLLAEAACYARRKGVPFMPCFSYHESERYGGCSWWEGRGGQAAARDHVLKLRSDAERYFPGLLYPIALGERTHDGSLILHGDREGELLDMAELGVGLRGPELKSELNAVIKRLLPSKPVEIISALVHMMSCNSEYIEERRLSHPKYRVERHEETGLYVGYVDSSGLTGRKLNELLLLSVCHPNLREQTELMARIIDQNRKRLNYEGKGVLAVCRQYRGNEKRWLAICEAARLARKISSWIAKDVPSIKDYFVPLVGVIDIGGDHLFERIEF